MFKIFPQLRQFFKRSSHGQGLWIPLLLLFTFLLIPMGMVFAEDIDALSSVSAKGLKLSPNNLTLKEGDTAQIEATVTLSDGTVEEVSGNSDCVWESSNPNLVEVDHGDIVVLKSEAKDRTVKITATYMGKTATTRVTVKKYRLPTGLSFDQSSVDLYLDEQFNKTTVPISVTVNFDDNSQEEVFEDLTFTPSKAEVVAVDTVGVMTARSIGLAKVRVTYTDPRSGISKSGLVMVRVLHRPPLKELQLDSNPVLYVGETKELKAVANYGPEFPTFPLTNEVIYTSKQPDVVKVDGNTLYAIKPTVLTYVNWKYEGLKGKISVKVVKKPVE